MRKLKISAIKHEKKEEYNSLSSMCWRLFLSRIQPKDKASNSLLLEAKITVLDFAKQKETGDGPTPLCVLLQTQINKNHVRKQ